MNVDTTVNLEVPKNQIPKIKDLFNIDNLSSILNDAQGLAVVASNKTFGKSRKIPMMKSLFQRYMTVGCLLGEMKAIERLMSWLENTDSVDSFNPDHDVVQFIYGELCMYLLKLDNLLYQSYGVKSSVNKKEIERRTQDYLNNYAHRIKSPNTTIQ